MHSWRARGGDTEKDLFWKELLKHAKIPFTTFLGESVDWLLEKLLWNVSKGSEFQRAIFLKPLIRPEASV